MIDEASFIDGTKILANANKYSFVWKKRTIKYRELNVEKARKLLQEIKQVEVKIAVDENNVNTDLKLSEITGLKMYFFTGLNAALHVVPCNLSYDMICQKF